MGGCAGLGWVGLGWAGLGWAGLGWGDVGWRGVGWVGLGGVVVVVVRTSVYRRMFLHDPARDAPNWGARSPERKLSATPPPLPRPHGGGQPGPVLCTGPYIHRHNSRLCKITGTSNTVDELRNVIDQGICCCTQRTCNNLHSKRRPPYQCTATGETRW